MKSLSVTHDDAVPKYVTARATVAGVSAVLPTSSGIYAIRNTINDRRYIGSAKNFRERWYDHKTELRSNKHKNPILQNAYNKYGEGVFEFIIVDRVPVALLLIREQLHMNLYPDSYNICRIAGSRLGHVPTDETREKLRQANLGKKHTAETKARMSVAQTGRTHTDESKARMSESQKGHPTPPETRDKISEALTGRKLSDEHKANMSAASTGSVHTPEHNAKISAALTGHEVSPETRVKISDALTGRVIGPEALANMSEAQKGKKRTPETKARMSERMMGNTLFAGRAHSPESREKMRAAALVREARKRAEKEAAAQSSPTPLDAAA